jgi:hypothetical protein
VIKPPLELPHIGLVISDDSELSIFFSSTEKSSINDVLLKIELESLTMFLVIEELSIENLVFVVEDQEPFIWLTLFIALLTKIQAIFVFFNQRHLDLNPTHLVKRDKDTINCLWGGLYGYLRHFVFKITFNDCRVDALQTMTHFSRLRFNRPSICSI